MSDFDPNDYEDCHPSDFAPDEMRLGPLRADADEREVDYCEACIGPCETEYLR